MGAPFGHDGPCKYNRRSPYAHQFIRGICRRCGERSSESVDLTPWREFEAAQAEFRKAVDAFADEVCRTGLVSPETRTRWYAMSSRLAELRLQEAKWANPSPESGDAVGASGVAGA